MFPKGTEKMRSTVLAGNQKYIKKSSGLKLMSQKKYCPECGGELHYDPANKIFVCKSCGRIYTHEQLIEQRARVMSEIHDEDQSKKKRKELLKWWLSEKK